MQKNIVSSVNRAMAKQSNKSQKNAASAPASESLSEIKEELQHLKEENAEFARAMEEVRAQNQELKDKIDQLISSKAKKKKSNSKKNA